MWYIIIFLFAILIALLYPEKYIRGGNVDADTAANLQKTYLFSGYDGSYFWYLAELMQKDGWKPAEGPDIVDGFMLKGRTAGTPECTYYHQALDCLYNFNYNEEPVKFKFTNKFKFPTGFPNPGNKASLYENLAGKSYFPDTKHITKFKYLSGKYLAQGISNNSMFKATWGGLDITIINNQDDFNRLLKYYFDNKIRSRFFPSQYEILYDIYIMPLIPSKRINDRAFVMTFYVMVDDSKLRLYEDYAFICLCKNREDVIALCLDEDVVSVFPNDYNGDSTYVLEQVKKIVKDCEILFAADESKNNFKIYNMDILVDVDEKCWLLEFNSYFKFYDVEPIGAYAEAMHGLTKWTYDYGIKPRARIH